MLIGAVPGGGPNGLIIRNRPSGPTSYEGIISRTGNASVGLVLGHVIAHELGHLLLQRASHSAAGLMRATLDLQSAQQGRLLFTADESQAIRAAIVRNADRR